MPYKTFNSWIFDGNMKSNIPNPELLLKYDSPINFQYILNLFILNRKLCIYLNEYFNNTNIWYLDKEEFFKFIKKCIYDFKVQKNSFPFFSNRNSKHKLFDILRKKCPELKLTDIATLCNIIDSHEDKDEIYRGLGFDKIEKVKSKKENLQKNNKIGLNEFLLNFNIVKEGK